MNPLVGHNSKVSSSLIWCVFCLLSTVIFIKCVLFHWICYDTILISSLWRNPWQFILFYIPKLAPAITLASFVLISKYRGWTIVLCLIIDVWIIANLVYYKANESFLNLSVITMVGNMRGFWDSVVTYFEGIYLLFFFITFIYSVFFIFIQKKGVCIRFVKPFLYMFSLGLLLHILSHTAEFIRTPRKDMIDSVEHQFVQLNENERDKHIDSYRSFKQFIPFRVVYWHAKVYTFDWIPAYVRNYSIIQYALAMFVYDIFCPKEGTLSKEDISIPNNLFMEQDDNELHKPTSSLIIILVESLENWVFNISQCNVTPNMSSLLNSEHVLYCNKLKSQVKQGVSGDGQMIINTGLLPTKVGAACMLYPRNRYPNFAQFYDHSYIFNPSPDTWNQRDATINYGYKQLIQRENSNVWEDDSQIIAKFDSVLAQTSGKFCSMIITIASHTPFNTVPICTEYENLQENKYLKKYISCVHYTDSCLGTLIKSIETDSVIRNSTIVITGDHTIFKPAMLRELQESGTSIEIPSESYVPLIIYSPLIKDNIQILDTCYQMDIYPTIMNLIGCEAEWKGFGVNLLDSAAIKERKITEKEAYELSDKMIRLNWFEKAVVNSQSSATSASQDYIAHAAGAIDGFIYTNSLEAVQHAIDKDIRYIELDLSLTCDSHLVASHEWAGIEYSHPSYKEFMECKIYNRYTPIDMIRLDSILQANPELNIVTDKISDPIVIDKYFKHYRNRIWVECFSEEDYFRLKKSGYNVLRSKRPPTKLGVLKRIVKRCSLNDYLIRNYVFRDTTYNTLENLYGSNFAIFCNADVTINDADSIFLKDKRVRFVYVDYFY